ncbi:MAG: hypothetical protein P3X22_000085 [Thermoprotei archaeon]|nr:hypothetical protein [Thermoprotei archaeon]
MREKFRRIVVLSGVTGVEVGSLLEVAAREFKVPVLKFEEFLEEAFHAPIYEAVEMLLVSRSTALARFKAALDRMLRDLEATKAVVGVHLTYYRRRHIIPNPAIWDLVSAAGEVQAILYVEDYYHALHRLAERVRRGRTPGAFTGQPLDPLGYLYWRASDFNMASLLEYRGNVRVVVYGLKHTLEGHKRLLAHALGEPYGGVARFRSAYVSHPITKVRARALEAGEGLWGFQDSVDIEMFKERLEARCRNIIVYSPTTIDELITGAEEELKTVIEKGDRWPHPSDTPHSYEYPINLASQAFNEILYPVDKTVLNKGYMEALKSAIETQIESRDLAYVNQADIIVAYKPTMYGEQHVGVETEIDMAHALSKTVYSIIPEEKGLPAHPMKRYGLKLGDEDALYSTLKCG